MTPPTAARAHRVSQGDMNTVIFTGTVYLRPSVQNSPRFFIRKHRGVLQKSSSDSLSRKMAVNPLSIVRARFSGGRGGGDEPVRADHPGERGRHGGGEVVSGETLWSRGNDCDNDQGVGR